MKVSDISKLIKAGYYNHYQVLNCGTNYGIFDKRVQDFEVIGIKGWELCTNELILENDETWEDEQGEKYV